MEESASHAIHGSLKCCMAQLLLKYSFFALFARNSSYWCCRTVVCLPAGVCAGDRAYFILFLLFLSRMVFRNFALLLVSVPLAFAMCELEVDFWSRRASCCFAVALPM